MTSRTTLPPALTTDAYRDHARLLCTSYARWTGHPLVVPETPGASLVRRLFHAPFALVSHGTEADPVFNFGNAAALAAFAMDWDAFTRLPSRKSAEPLERTARADLLARVTAHGYVDDYRGVRIDADGRRFTIDRATVWNLVDDAGRYRGQAARFDGWTYLDGSPR